MIKDNTRGYHKERAVPGHLVKWVEYLAREVGPRPAARPDILQQVAETLAARLTDLHYKVECQSVPYRKTYHLNVIASPQDEAVRDPNDLLIVGAHYDTVSRTPGADDNASGIAGVLELARIFADYPPPGLRLVAFCPEEPPAFRTKIMGSYVYAESLHKRNVQLQGMICLEMIGFYREVLNSQSYPLFLSAFYPTIGNYIALVGNLRSAKWTKKVSRIFSAGSDLPVERLNAPGIVAGIDFSDHWSFNRFGYPALMITDTAFYRNPHYHRYSDTPETLDYGKMAKVVDGLARVIDVLG